MLIKKYLSSVGWDKAWVDVVVERIQKNSSLGASVATAQAAYEFLTGLGVPSQSVCNMAALCYEIMGTDINSMRAVVDYIRSRGVDGEMLVTELEAYPKLLTYTASGDVLQKDQTRASVDIIERNGVRKAITSLWREGTSFTSSPVSPVKPSSA